MNRFDIIELAQQTITFVHSAFNGKVNALDPYTRLNFVSGYLDKKTNIARTTPYGCIYVSLEAFADTVEAYRFIDTDQIRNLALEIIIHELTHVDQLIDYRYIKFNNGYREEIERQCVKQSCQWILDNIQFIRSLGLVVIPEVYEERLVGLSDVTYSFKNPAVIAMSKLEHMIGKKFREFNSTDIEIHYVDRLKNYYKIPVCVNRIYQNSQNLNDLGERLLNDKQCTIEYMEYGNSKLVIKITQGV